jgi:hypothetical protein
MEENVGLRSATVMQSTGKQKIFFILTLLIQIIAISYYSNLRIHNSYRIKESRVFGDTSDYFHNANASVFSGEFWIDARPPVTALFWKTVNSNPEGIRAIQMYFSIFCWIILAFVTSGIMTKWLLKPLIFIFVLAFSLSRDVFMWDAFLGSESIGLSFLALFLAIALWLFQEWRDYKIVLLVIVALLLAFTRDTYAYLLLMIALINIPIFWSSKFRKETIVISVTFFIIFGVSSKLADIGLRPYNAILMNTSLRIYPSEKYTEYFREHGMPVDDNLVTMARDIKPHKKFSVYMTLLYDEYQEGFRQWASKFGKSEYIRFLWFFKEDTFQNILTEEFYPSFSPDVYYYTATGYRPILKNAYITEFLYPTRFGRIFFFFANFVAAFMVAIAWYKKKSHWYIPLLMVLLCYPQAVLVWAADVNDIARHSIPHNVLLRLGSWILLFFIMDENPFVLLKRPLFVVAKN